MGLMKTLTLSMKIFTVSVGFVSRAVGMKSAVPIALNAFPMIWSIILSWLKPPFLYLIINGIILTIAAFSRAFSDDQNHPRKSNVLSEPLMVSASTASLPQDLAVLSFQAEMRPAAAIVYDKREEINKVGSKTESREDGIAEKQDEEACADTKPAHDKASAEVIISTELQLEYPSRDTEKPLVSSRFSHRKPIRSCTPEGASALRVARPKRQETVENTWRAITEGCQMPLTKHHHKRLDPPKSDTFKSRSKFDPSSHRIRRDPSLSRDELNSRVEEFITKFNEDMRLQRQLSLQQFMEMINRGA